MATGREGRAERLNERLRGAQRANVNDDSFNIDIGGLDIGGLAIASTSPAPPVSTEYSPTTSAKRRKLDKNAPTNVTAQRSGSTPRRRSTRSQAKDPYDLPETSKDSTAQGDDAQATEDDEEETPRPATVRRRTQTPSSERTVTASPEEENQDELAMLPVPSSAKAQLPLRSPVPGHVSAALIEEIGESPADAPGSGKRRRILPLADAVSSSVRLFDAMTSEEVFPQSSSPLVRRTRRSDAFSVRSNRRSTGALASREVSLIDELSPGRPTERERVAADDEPSEAQYSDQSVQENATDIEPGNQEQEEQEEESRLEEGDAEEVDAVEAAKVLGKNRTKGPRQPSPELGSASVDEEGEAEEGHALVEADEVTASPTIKRRRHRPVKSPAVQKQPAAKAKPNKPNKRPRQQAQGAGAESGENESQEPRPKKAKAQRRQSGEEEEDGDDGTIDITVQRFVNLKRRGDGDDDADPLHGGIPFANRGGETVVDVFAQVCDEVIQTALEQYQAMVNNTEETARKKEFRIKIRAVEAYREELNARFLQHAIHLNHWHSLRKRVRHAQKEKIALREEIIRIRGEREQVALRMDAVRIKHEADTKESKHCLDASALMYDVDLAVEQGRDAPELSRSAQQEAELANLELLISRISEEASSSSLTGGMLKQIKEFNALLERAAVALESR